MSRFLCKARRKQMRGSIRKLWGKLIHDPYEEFFGEQIMMEGKLEEYYAGRSSGSRRSSSASPAL